MVEFNRQYYQGTFQEKHLERVRERKKVVRERTRDFIINYLRQHPCDACGEIDVRVLEFHHVGEKDMAIVNMIRGGYSIERFAAEISECEVLCANCHRKLTVEEIGQSDKHPMFLEKRVYQGSSGAVFPHPVIDRVFDEKEDKAYTSSVLKTVILRS